jgi:ribonuclease E
MRMLMPSHARHVQLYRDSTPVFSRNNVEGQLDAMFSPQVTLKSGGYLVINQTEALVSIDVNSGRATREHSIEDTALNTNLEAAEEIARQLRLRDLAGLIVIDFIDMEEKRNNRAVERKLKDCLRADRARIQVGRISHFGLLEMSRQRIRTGVLESSVVPCPHCRGTGQVRSISSLSLQILRALEDHLLRHRSHHLLVRTRPEVALYVLNQKRTNLGQLEERFGLSISISDEAPENGAGFTIERGAPVTTPLERTGAESVAMIEEAEAAEPFEEETEAEEAAAESGRDRRRRRRRRRGNGDDRHDHRSPDEENDRQRGGDVEVEAEEAGQAEATQGDADADERRRRRRGRRGGRRRGRGRENGTFASEATSKSAIDDELDEKGEYPELAGNEDETAGALLPPVEAFDASSAASGDGQPAETAAGAPDRRDSAPVEEQTNSGPAETRSPEGSSEHTSAPTESAPAPEPQEEDSRPKRTGWWNRGSSFF